MPRIEKYDHSESGLAYGYMMIVLYLFAAVFIWVCYSHVFNLFLTMAINPSIDAGEVSIQTANAAAWNINIFRYAPPIILLFGFLFGVNRAIFKRGGAS